MTSILLCVSAQPSSVRWLASSDANPGRNSHEQGGKNRTRLASLSDKLVACERVDSGRTATGAGGGTTATSVELSDPGPVGDRKRSATLEIGLAGNSGLLSLSANFAVSLGPVGQGSAVDHGSTCRSLAVSVARVGGGPKGLT